MYGEDAVLAIFGVIYLLFLGLWWLCCGIIAHSILNRKGYQHAGLYIFAWIPLVNFLAALLAIGLPDVLLHRKMDYLLRQMVATGLIHGPYAPQPAGCTPQTGAPSAPTQSSAPVFQVAQTANPAPGQPMWQPHTTAAPAENLFRPDSSGNNQNS